MTTKISHAQKATFQATYAVGGSGGTAMVTVVQQPPSSAFLTAANRIVSTGGFTYISGLDQALAGVLPSGGAGTTDTGLSDFTVCITAGRVLARFSGGLTDGGHGDVLLTSYSATVDPALLEVPQGAQTTS